MRSSSLLKRGVLFAHRWMGVALSLIFLMWFASGIVMLYCDFPAVQSEDRLDRSPRLDASQVHILPSQARSNGSAMRLRCYGGRPAYIFGNTRLFADSGEPAGPATPEFAARVASAWVSQSASLASIESIDEPDQWTVQGPLRRERPLWKFSWPGGQQVYVSGLSGEVVQYTTSASRLAAYFGAIPHWMYFTPLRKRQSLWTRIVIWTSAAGAIAALLGMVAGVWMYRFKKGQPGIPYRGQKRWHMLLGLAAGVTAVTWAFSGMLSMDPFPVPAPDRSKVSAILRDPLDLAAFDAKPPAQALRELAPLDVRELELISFAGEPAYLARLHPRGTRIVPVHGAPSAGIGTDRIKQAFADAFGSHAGWQVLEKYDAYYRDRHGLRPLPVVLVTLDDRDGTRYYVDPQTAQLVGSDNSRGWTARWLYHGLHSLDFPGLYNRRPLWDIVTLALLLGGAALSVTSILLSWNVLRRALR